MAKRFEDIAPQMLYILQNGSTNEYKIGITNNLNRRYSALQTGCPNELRIVKIWTHTQRKFIEKYERVLHNFFKSVRIRNNGEWFKLSAEDVAELCKPNSIFEQNEYIENCLKSM